MSRSGSRNLRMFFLMRLERVLLKVHPLDDSLVVLLSTGLRRFLSVVSRAKAVGSTRTAAFLCGLGMSRCTFTFQECPAFVVSCSTSAISSIIKSTTSSVTKAKSNVRNTSGMLETERGTQALAAGRGAPSFHHTPPLHAAPAPVRSGHLCLLFLSPERDPPVHELRSPSPLFSSSSFRLWRRLK